jgi:hypothetical protein
MMFVDSDWEAEGGDKCSDPAGLMSAFALASI